jgi:hypothetical protein
MAIMAEARRYVDLKELSAGMQLSVIVLRRYIRSGRLRAHKGGKKNLVSGEALQSFIEQGQP